MARVHSQPGQSNQLLQKNYVTVNVNKFHEHQIYLTESRRLHAMEESLVPPLRNHVLTPPILRRG